jgi:hypothetical protein
MLVVDQNISVPSLSGLHVNDGLVSILHWYVFISRPNTLLSKKVQHLPDLSWWADQAACQTAALKDQSKHCHSSIRELVEDIGQIMDLLLKPGILSSGAPT